MTHYIIGRMLQMVVIFIGVTMVIFGAVFLIPGNPVAALGGGQPLPDTVVHNLELKYHLNEPFIQQYGHYLWGLLHGDLGMSVNGRSVSDLIGQSWPVTLKLALTAWVLEVVLGIAVGIVAALRHRRATDKAVLLVTTLGLSVPVFVIGFTAQVAFGIELGIAPIEGTESGWPASYIMPALALAFFSVATVGRLTRASLLENLRSDYVRTAIAKGLPRRWVIGKHALKNSILPVITYLGIDLGFLLGGTVIIEGIFNIPGIGLLLFNSVQIKDGPVVVGIASALVIVFLTANLIVDILYAALDPRIRYD
ncbi:MAG: ABC transporter permease [Nocardioidaceae bacterium]